jgi:bla regulator protein blaR1
MIAYIIKSSVSLLVMFGIYWFLLRQEKLFIFNRVFLIFSIIFSLALPFISIPVNIRNNEPQGKILTTLNSAIPSYSSEQNPSSNLTYQSYNETEPLPAQVSDGINHTQILLLIYITGVILLMVRFVRNIFLIYRQMHISEKIFYSGQKLVLTNNQINPFCFFNIIFVSKQDYLNNVIAEELLTHELEHIRQSHSIDVIFIELIKIIYWFNPILLLYSRAIRTNHEYLADNGVIRSSSDIKDYADKLINYISCKRNVPLTSGFNPTMTRKRLIMLTKSRSGMINYGARIFVTLILAAALLLILSFKPSYSQPVKDAVKQQQESGVPHELLKEYQDILNKYKRTAYDGQTIYSLNQNMKEKDRLETIFFQMSKEQQAKQMFVFVPKNFMILTKSTLTIKQFESFKDPKMYGVWIDDIKVNNTELNKYKNTDFAYMVESILFKNAKDYGKYVSQVNLMTNQGYQTYYNKAVSEKGNVLFPNKLNLMSQVEASGEQTNSGLRKAESSTIGHTWETAEKSTSDTQIAEKLIIVDGAVYTKKLDDIPIETIENFRVLGNFQATNKYGEKGRNGVIVITTKGKTSVPTGIKTSETPKAELQVNEDGVAAATNMNVLYLGISNPVEIAVPGVTSDKVTATITNGTITRTTTGWEVKPSSFNDLVLTILVNNKKVSEKKFRVKQIPSPVAVFAGINNGTASKDVLATGNLEAELKDFLWDLKFEIESFTLAFSKDGFDREITSKGNKLTDEMRSIISVLKPGQFIIFKDIKAIGPDGKLKDLNPLILKIE